LRLRVVLQQFGAHVGRAVGELAGLRVHHHDTGGHHR